MTDEEWKAWNSYVEWIEQAGIDELGFTSYSVDRPAVLAAAEEIKKLKHTGRILLIMMESGGPDPTSDCDVAVIEDAQYAFREI